MSIHVITNDRLASLMRLVKSLQDSHFLGDEVGLSFHVDVDANGEMMDYLMVSGEGRSACCYFGTLAVVAKEMSLLPHMASKTGVRLHIP